jgi:hypothetical protein
MTPEQSMYRDIMMNEEVFSVLQIIFLPLSQRVE